MIHTESESTVTVVTIDHGPMNMLDLETLTELRDAIAALPTVPVVLTGSAGVFSAGFDIARIIAEPTSYTAEMLATFEDLVTSIVGLDVPVVAALPGHAIGAGFIIAAACDARIVAGGRHGAPESRVGFPVPPASLEVLRALAPRQLRTAVYGGALVGAEQLVERGIADFADRAELPGAGRALAQSWAGPSLAAFALHKAMVSAPLRRAINAARARHHDVVSSFWCSESARAAAAEYLRSLRSS